MAQNLELGGGQSPKEGYINMDAFERPEVDIIHNAIKPWPIESESLDNISSCEFIEHLTEEGLKNVLNESYRTLKSGGKFEFSCPDFQGIAEMIMIAPEKERNYMRRGILGDGSMEFDYHRNIIWFSYIKELMENAGFTDIKRLPAENYDHLLSEGFTPEFIQKVKLRVEGYKK